MCLAIYDNTVLLSPTYCARKIGELKSKEQIMLGTGMEFLYEEEFANLSKQIDYYMNCYTYISSNWEKMNDEEFVDFITDEIVAQVKKYHYRTMSSIYFEPVTYVSENIVRIHIWDFFETEVTFSKRLYIPKWEYNEHYDAYHDLCENVYRSVATEYLQTIVNEFKKKLDQKLPNIEKHYYIA